MFTGLSAFPLTPLTDDRVDEKAFAALVERLGAAEVDSITALGSTGCYPYLSREERAQVAQLAVRHAGPIPVMIGIGALRTRHVLELARDAQHAGASALLLAPMSYQALTEDDVYGLFETVAAHVSVPLVVYDNPGTTHFTFGDELYARLARLPHVASVKIPGVPADPGQAAERVTRLRALLPDTVTVGVSGDALAATGLGAGCQVWYSVIGGTLPGPALDITRAETAEAATAASNRLQPLWDLFARHGSLRVVSALAELLGLAGHQNLPLPIRALGDEDRAHVARVSALLGLR